MRDASPLAVGAAIALIFVMLIESLVFAILTRRAMIRAERAHLRAEAAATRAAKVLADILRIREGEAAHRADR